MVTCQFSRHCSNFLYRFVHEGWISPLLFSCASGPNVSELKIADSRGSVEGSRSVLERHWDTWVTQADMGYLAGIAINTVRLPIGYWNHGPKYRGGTGYDQVSFVYQTCWPRVGRAANMAGKSGLGVLVDLHGPSAARTDKDILVYLTARLVVLIPIQHGLHHQRLNFSHEGARVSHERGWDPNAQPTNLRTYWNLSHSVRRV